MKKVLTVVVTLIVLAMILIGISRWIKEEDVVPPIAGPETEEPVQPEHCPDVEFLSLPGTWESSPTDDPLNPTFNPNSYMLSITQPLQEQHAGEKVKIWTLPYTAQFRNINAPQEMTYDDSRNEGTATTEAELSAVHAECPLTDFIIAGFSQGAVIGGDIANKIGTGVGVIPAERVRGVALVADGRREPGVGQHVGNPVAGIGAEVSLRPVERLVQAVTPGASMRGPRPGGFGDLQDRVFEICAPDDSVCDAPVNIVNAIERAQSLIQPNIAHSTYATNPNVVPDSTATAWIIDWANQLIESSKR